MKTIQATVVSLLGASVVLKVRRVSHYEYLDQPHKVDAQLKVGDKIQVRRVANNPYLVFVSK